MPPTPKTTGGEKPPASKPRAGFADPAVAAVFSAYPKPLQTKLLALRRLILDTARATKGVGALEEILKWGQPSYLTTATKSGSTVRIDQVKAVPGQVALYFHCQTDLVATFRELYPETGLRRQPQHPFERRGQASRSRVASLRGTGADVSSEQAEGGTEQVSASLSIFAAAAVQSLSPCGRGWHGRAERVR